MPQWQDDRPLFTWDVVLQRAEAMYPPRYDHQTDYRAVLSGDTEVRLDVAYCHLFEAVRSLLLDYDEQRSRGESLDDVEFAAPYPGEF